ncbi:MAG TPA: T9SS type A sorting domain-containing protein, partial [Bacteroidota bacterium]|nr:T9SS type A sorting domain-containing protein [Bacteroidota bacterium]
VWTGNSTNWKSFSSGLTPLTVQAVDILGNYILAGSRWGTISPGATCEVYASSDTGLHWNALGFNRAQVLCFTNRNGSIIAGTDTGVYISMNKGVSWEMNGLAAYRVASLALSGDNLFAGTDRGVYLSTYGSGSWTQSNEGLTDSVVGSFAVAGANVFAGTDSGVFLTSDSGKSWHAVNTGLANTHVIGMGVCGSSLFVTVSDTNSIWRRPLEQMILSVGQVRLRPVAQFTLGQNYPNPFNPTTTIRFSIPHRSQVILSIFNTLGQLISTILNDAEEAGDHEVRFDGGGLASGVYFYRLRAGDFVAVKRLVLVR